MSGFSISGLGSGIDFSVYVDAVRQGEEAAIARTLGTRQIRAQAEEATLNQVKGLLDDLKNAAAGFKFAQDFKTKSVTSSDQDVVTATAKVSTPISTASVAVEQLATNEIWEGTFTGVDDSISSTDGTFTIEVRGVSHDIEVTSGMTLSELSEAINEANIGVTSTVYDIGDGGATSARLTITDNTIGKFSSDQTPGAEYNITLSSTTLTEFDETDFGGGGTTPLVEGLDAKIQINNDAATDIYRDSNTITDLFPGLTLKLASESGAGVFVDLTVTESTADASKKIENFVTKYNDAIGFIRKAIAFDPNQEVQTNPTAGNSTLRNILTNLQGVVTRAVSTLPADNAITSLADLGVETQFNSDSSAENGLLDFTASTFNEALDANYDDVITFFEGLTSEGEKFVGWGETVGNSLDSMVKPVTGTLTSKIDSVGDELRRIQDDINERLERLARKESLMTERFARLEVQLSKLNSQQSALTSALSSIANNNTAIANRRR